MCQQVWKRILSTASEINNDYFTVEKSTDAENYAAIATLKGAGNSNINHTYSYVDNKPFDGTCYYRLKQTDYNGDSKIFKPTSVQCKTNTSISAYTNQDGNIVINSQSDERGKWEAILFDELGKKIIARSFTIESGNSNYNIDTSPFHSGIYFLSIQNERKIYTKKIVLE